MQEKETNKTLWSRARQWLSPLRSASSRAVAKINRPRIKWVLIFTALGLVLGLAYSFIVEGISSTTSSLGTGVITGLIANWVGAVYHRGKRELGAQVDEAIQAALSDINIPRDRHTYYSECLREYYRSRNSSWAKSEEEQRLIEAFDARVAEQPTASNFRIEELLKQVSAIGMTDQYIQAILGELPVREGREATMRAIDQMLEAGRIHSESARDLIKEIASYVLEHTEELQAEIQRLRQSDNNSLAEALEGIRGVVGRESNQSLRGVLDAYSNREKQDDVRRLQDKARLLTELIEAAQVMFTFDEACYFYERLLELEPTAQNHFNYAYLLQELYEFGKARKHYEEALKMYRELELKDPQAYKPDVAQTLNNLGVLMSEIGKLGEAQKHYEEALKRYRELERKNPQAYKPDHAMTLNNLGILLGIIGELDEAKELLEDTLERYRELEQKAPQVYKADVAITQYNLALLYSQLERPEEAEQAYREVRDTFRRLAQEQPAAYELAYARTLIMGVALLRRPIEELEAARTILLKYSKHPEARGLQGIIEQLIGGSQAGQ